MYKKRFTLNSLIIMIAMLMSRQATMKVELSPKKAPEVKETFDLNCYFHYVRFMYVVEGNGIDKYRAWIWDRNSKEFKIEKEAWRTSDTNYDKFEWHVIPVNAENLNDGIYIIPNIESPDFNFYLSWDNEKKRVYLKETNENFKLTDLEDGVWNLTNLENNQNNLRCIFQGGIDFFLKESSNTKYVDHKIGNDRKNDELKIVDNSSLTFLMKIERNQKDKCLCFVFNGLDQNIHRDFERGLGVLETNSKKDFTQLNFVTPGEGDFYWYFNYLDKNKQATQHIIFELKDMYLKPESEIMYLDSYETNFWGSDYLRLRKETRVLNEKKNEKKTTLQWWTDRNYFYNFLRIKTWLEKMNSEDCLKLKQLKLII
jgi:hypothetical protein